MHCHRAKCCVVCLSQMDMAWCLPGRAVCPSHRARHEREGTAWMNLLLGQWVECFPTHSTLSSVHNSNELCQTEHCYRCIYLFAVVCIYLQLLFLWLLLFYFLWVSLLFSSKHFFFPSFYSCFPSSLFIFSSLR